MGTETNSLNKCIIDKDFHFVKLNNPLMGTETTKRPIAERPVKCLLVKLNNPLMGTETIYFIFC